ncbi:MAG: sigma-54-dependent transcriptional regulator [Salinibacter sp.]
MPNSDLATTESPHVLTVDDEAALHGVLEQLFLQEDIEATCTSGQETLQKLKEDALDLVLTNVQIPGIDGIGLLEHATEPPSEVSVVLLSTQENVQQTVRIVRSGIVDYISKPFSTDELTDRIKTLLDKHQAEAQAGPSPSDSSSDAVPEASASASSGGSVNGTALSEEKGQGPGSVRFVGEHQSVQKLRKMVDRIASYRTPVFVQGESGTGKKILSRLLHEKSDRADQPYVSVNCAALPSDLVENHLFGHVERAFTGAVNDMVAALEEADGGTLLLNEISELSPTVQAKLLRVLQTQEFRKIGSSDKTPVDIRVIATSNRDPKEAVEKGSFREDLYHRLAVSSLHVPPLRGRLSDIPVLVEHFLSKYTEQYDLPPKTIAPDLLRRFRGYSWPGNVQELENMIHWGVVMAGERWCIETDDVIDFFSSSGATGG